MSSLNMAAIMIAVLHHLMLKMGFTYVDMLSHLHVFTSGTESTKDLVYACGIVIYLV